MIFFNIIKAVALKIFDANKLIIPLLHFFAVDVVFIYVRKSGMVIFVSIGLFYEQ